MATVEELKQYLGITDSSEDALLAKVLDAALETIESETGRSFTLVEESRYIDVERYASGELLMVPDLQGITAVYMLADSDTPLEVTQYYLEPGTPPYWGIRLPRGERWLYYSDPTRGARVDGTWGYGAIADYPDLDMAQLRIAAILYRSKEIQAIEVISIPGLGTRTTTWPRALPQDIVMTLRNHRRLA